MKALARSYLWWPKLDEEIETRVCECNACQANLNAPPVAPIHPWNWPSEPWKRIHVDHFEFEKSFYLIVIDSHSKWIEVIPTRLMTAAKTIEILRNLFSSYGLPEVIVPDNGPGFVSQEFQRFIQMNGIRHIVSPPYHPAFNRPAERAVQIVKQALQKQVLDKDSTSRVKVQHRLSNFLFKYRCTQHTVTGQSRAELFLKRPLRNSFSLLKPNLRQRVESQQDKQLKDQARNRSPRELETNQTVRVRNFQGGKEKWVLGKIVKKLSPRTFQV
jgi:ribosomal protein L31E